MTIELSVVVPVHNEAESLPELHRRLSQALAARTEQYELIFVDDGSVDGSFAILRDLQQADDHTALIQLRRRHGKATALATGFRVARGEIIIMLDADLQDRPEEIPKLLDGLEAGSDLVTGWRANRQDRYGKRLASRIFNRVTAWLSGVELHDLNCGLKAFRHELLDELRVHGELHRYLPVLAHWRGFHVSEVVVEHDPRRYGVSSYGRERFLRGMLDLLTVMILTRYLRRPLHLFGGLGLALALVGTCIDLYLGIGWALGKWWLGDRPLLVLGVLLVIIGVQFILFGLLAEMVAHTRSDDADVAVRTSLPARQSTHPAVAGSVVGAPGS